MTFTPRSSSLGPNILRCLFVAIWLSAVCAFGADIYVSHPGAGTQDGSSAGNAHSLVWLNAWSGINPGDTVHLVGLFTNGIDIVQIVGATNNPVTFYWESGCHFTAPAWGNIGNIGNSYSNGSAIYMNNVYGLILDGGSGGYLNATDNGSGYLTWSNQCNMIDLTMQGGSFEIKNLSISNSLQRYNGGDLAYATGHAGDPNYVVGGNGIIIGGGFTNSSIHNCTLVMGPNLIQLAYNQPMHGVNIYSNTVSQCSFGIGIYGYYQASGDGVQIWANNINVGNAYSGYNSAYHGDNIILNMHQGNYPLLFTSATTVNTQYNPVNGYSIVNYSVGAPAPGEAGDYYSYFTWDPQGDTNNTYIQLGFNSGQIYTSKTNFFMPANGAIYMHGTPGSNNTSLITWTPTTNTSYVCFSTNSAVYYSASGTYNVPIPQFGPYGSYYNYFAVTNNILGIRDTNNIGINYGPGVGIETNNASSEFVYTNTLVLLGTPNAQVTATLTWLHAATNSGAQIYRNFFGPIFGTNASTWLGVYADMPSGVQNTWVYDNILVIDNITTNEQIGDAYLNSDNAVYANNTMVQISTNATGHAVQGGFAGGQILNNFELNFQQAWDFNSTNVDHRGVGRVTNDNFNVYTVQSGFTWDRWRPTADLWPQLWYVTDTSSIFFGVGIYQMPQFDNNSSTNLPLIGWTSGLPPVTPIVLAPLTNDTVLNGAGTNLTALALANGIYNLTNDYFGNPRPTTGPWTIGAIQGTFTNPPPVAPTIIGQPGNLQNITNTTLTSAVTYGGTSPVWITCYLTNSGGLTSLQAGVSAGSFSSNSPTAQTNLMVFILTNLQGSATSSICSQGWTNGLTAFFNLTVDGNLSIHAPGDVVSITCTNSSTFNGWTNTAGTIANSALCGTTVTMPSSDATVTSLYTNYVFKLTVDGNVSYHTNGEFVPIQCYNSALFQKWIYTAGFLFNNGCDSVLQMPAKPFNQSISALSVYTNGPTVDYPFFFLLLH